MTDRNLSSDEDKLEALQTTISRLGGFVEDLVWRAFRALADRHPQHALQILRDDTRVDAFESEVQDTAISLITQRQLVADDLRRAVSVLKIAAELERVGGLAKNIAHRALTISTSEAPRHLMVGLQHMMELAAKQLGDVLDAWGTGDASKALAVRNGDERLDALYSSVFRETLTWMLEDPRHIEHCAHLLFVAKNLERIGDHTTNIAEQIVFAVDGVVLRQERSKRDDTSTLSNMTTVT